ncbi:MAG: HDOD domain-containing protein [Desulfobacterales bacterium]|nr:HDOD domain-containing protein [Desulfobacterales bacterium]
MKRRILFVDDEPNVLQGLKRVLREMRNEWDMDFVESGNKALEILQKSSFDVIVSDIRMKEMDGIEFFKKVMNLYPKIIRIVLSGQSDKEFTIKSSHIAHQYLVKPCDPDELKSRLSHIYEIQGALSNNSLIDVVSKIKTLPILPTIYTEILKALESFDANTNDIGKIISKDVGITAKILQLVNSAFLGLRTRIVNIEQAVTYLGIDIIKSLVLSNYIFYNVDAKKNIKNFINKLWNHSLSTGIISRLIAYKENPDLVDCAFLAGLLHDCGKIIFLINFPDQYETIIESSQSKENVIFEKEMGIFGTSHAEIGAYLMSLWGLPMPVIEAILYHHFPLKYSKQEFTPLTSVYVANFLSRKNESTENDLEENPSFEIEYLSKLRLLNRLPIWQNSCQGIILEENLHE